MTYTGTGQTVTTTITTTITTTYVYRSDPLSESFYMPREGYVTGVGLFFTAKDSVESNNIVVELRNMVNGFPGTTTYARKLVPGKSIVADEKGRVETRVTFDDPVYCNAIDQYCFVVLTDSSSYCLAIAELAQPDMVTGANVASNPFTGGVLFSSSNALSWTVHNGADLEFNLYTAKFSATAARCDFGKVACADGLFDRLELSYATETPSGTQVTWEVELNDSGVWLPIS